VSQTTSVSDKNDNEGPLNRVVDFFILYARDAFVEFWRAVRGNTIPWSLYAWTVVLGLIFTLRLDALVWRELHGARFYPFHPFLYWPYVAFFMTLWPVLWFLIRVRARRAMTRQLTMAFRNSGLETRTKRVPGYVADHVMDTHMRKLILSSVGLPESEFIRAKSALEANLQVFIDQIKPRVERGIVEIHYSHDPLLDYFPFDTSATFEPLTFLLGMTRTQGLYVCLRDVPHILIAGYTNSGKSGVMRQALMTLILNNPGIEFTLIDLKFGIELGIFEGLPSTKLYSTPLAAIEALKYVEAQLDKRMALLRANRCNDFDAFQRLPKEKRKYPPDWPKEKTFTRHVVAIDEAAELFMASASLASKDAQVAKRLTAKIAALGRAVGIHLMIATQRPDRHAVDPLIKTNLQGRLCFQMADNASSMTILDSARAADLPATKGRAIWRSGFDLIEVQVPWLEREAMEPILAPRRLKQAENPQDTTAGTSGTGGQSPSHLKPSDPASVVEDGIARYERAAQVTAGETAVAPKTEQGELTQ
jgi:hypothetical protein